MKYPKLRADIEIFPVEMASKRILCLRDRFNYTDNVAILPIESYNIISLFDGRHSLLDIQAELMRRFGELLYREKIEELVEHLDRNFFLEGERFQAHRDRLVNQFMGSPVRQASLAGKSYQSAPQELVSELSSYFNHPEGPGRVSVREPAVPIKGAVIPHIDYARAGPTYAWAYKELMARAPADLYVILGTAHVETREPFVLTAKDFETPLGTLRTDKELVQLLTQECGQELFADELVHRAEHSVELQAVLLQYAFGGEDGVTILPVLCGSFHQYVVEGAAPEDDQRVKKFAEALRKYMIDSGRKICVIASADLSHMGPRFGDREPVSAGHLRWIAEHDAEFLKRLEADDAEGLFRHIAMDKDRRRICGFPSIYTMLRIIGPARGKVLKYSQWAEADGTVTFASVIFT